MTAGAPPSTPGRPRRVIEAPPGVVNARGWSGRAYLITGRRLSRGRQSWHPPPGAAPFRVRPLRVAPVDAPPTPPPRHRGRGTPGAPVWAPLIGRGVAAPVDYVRKNSTLL